MRDEWKERIARLRRDIRAVGFACAHPDTPWYAKAVAALVVAYALSPIDLVPDFVPILGYVDDVILLPLGVALVVKLVPTPVLAECRARAATTPSRGRWWTIAGGAIVVALWLGVAALALILWRGREQG